MKSISTAGRPGTLWYVVWFVMLILSAADALAYQPILGSLPGHVFCLLLAVFAGVFAGGKFLVGRERALAYVLLAVFFMAQLVQIARTMGPPTQKRGVDYSAYFLAGKLVSESRAQDLYRIPLFPDGRMDVSVEDPTWHAAALSYQIPFSSPFLYPPFFAVVMKPLTHLSFRSGFAAWNLMTVVLVGGAVLLSLSLGGVRLNGRLALMFGVGLFSYFPFVDNLFYGQVSGIILFLFAAGLWLLVRRRIWMSALCIAAATMIKLTPALVVPVLIVHRRWKWLAAYAAWMAALLMFSVWQAGWSVHLQFWRDVMPKLSCGAPVCENSSILAYVQEIFLGHVPLAYKPAATLPANACAVSKYVSLAVYCLILARIYWRRRDGLVVRDVAVMVLLGVVLSPISWWHYFTIGLLPFVYLWGTMRGKSSRLLLVLFLIVGTNIVSLIRLGVVNHATQLILAAIVPGLTVALAYRSLTPGAASDPEQAPLANLA